MQIGAVIALAVLQFHPHAVEVDGVLHHRAVDQPQSEPLAKGHVDRPDFRKLLAVEAEDEALHVGRQR